MEHLLEGVIDDGWKYLDQDLIASCYHAPHEWVPLTRRILVAAEYVQPVALGDVSMDDYFPEVKDSS